MGTRPIRMASGVMVALGCLALWSAPAFGAAKAAGAGPDATKALGDETAAAKIEKQVANIQERMTALQQEEFTISMAAMKAQQAAQGTEDPNKIRDELAKGNHKREYLEYKAACENAAQQYQALAEKYLRVVNMVKILERDREKAPAELQPKIDELSRRAQDKYRSLVEKVADYYDRCANFKMALQIYLVLYQAAPEDKRDRTLKEKIADLYEKVSDLKNATALYKAIFDSLPEKSRFKDKKICEKLGGLYEKAGDPRSALAIYKGFWGALPASDRGKERGMGEKLADLLDKAVDLKSALEVYKVCYEGIPADKRENDGKTLRNKIYNLEIKLGLRKGTPVSAGSSNNSDPKYGKRR